jgi:tRNA nucleotidyltransferase (CCA-adding enzyme)
MKATEVIATHSNTDFDAFAAMLAARRLYPDAVVAVPGALNRNVREFYRLHADELDAVEVSRLEPEAVRRLIVVETTSATRLGELESVALDPEVEKVVFDHHGGELPDWVKPENAVLSQDGALTTTLVGVLPHVPDGDTARRRRACLVPAPRRAPGAARRVPAHAARRRRA